MGLARQFFDNTKLYLRYACRWLGFPGCQMHQIYLSKQKLIYIPIPKNAFMSVKHALHENEFGKRFNADWPRFSDYREHHDYYLKRPHAFTSVKRLRENSEFLRFALVRDSVKRLISCYRNRVVDLGDLEGSRKLLEQDGITTEPDLNMFVMTLEAYRQHNKNIEHHSRPQSDFLGGTIDYLDEIYTLDQMPNLLKMLQQYKLDLELRRRKTGGTEVQLN